MHLPAGGCRRARHQDRAAGGRFRARLRRRRARRERAISSGSTAARNRSSSISTKADDKALLAAMLAKADVFVQNLKPGAVGKLGFADRAAAARASAPDLLLDLGLWRERPLCDAQGLRSADPGRGRARLDHRRAGRARRASASRSPISATGMNAYEAILEALIARGSTGEGAEHFGLAVRRHGRLDDGAAAAARRRQAAEAHRPRAPVDRALRRVQDAATASTS